MPDALGRVAPSRSMLRGLLPRCRHVQHSCAAMIPGNDAPSNRAVGESVKPRLHFCAAGTGWWEGMQVAVKVMCHEGSTADRLNALHESLVAAHVEHDNVVRSKSCLLQQDNIKSHIPSRHTSCMR